MQTAADFRQERNELDALLASGIFNRAPNLAQVLTYVCNQYFEGAAEQIKEYNIAVEALGRPADFDQKRDSIVRVEAHRLRKRLREYYEADGARHAIRIEIPPGQYAPRFLPSGVTLPSLDAVSAETVPALQLLPLVPSHDGGVTPDTHPVQPVPLPHGLMSPFAAANARNYWRNLPIAGVLLLMASLGMITFWRGLEGKASKASASLPHPRVQLPPLTPSRCGFWRGI